METFNDAADLWKKSGNDKTNQLLNEDDVLFMIKDRIKKQKRTIAQYGLASWVWQFIFYALAVNLIVWVGGNRTILYMSMLGILLYIPFTVAYAKFFSGFIKNSGKRAAPIDSIAIDLKNQYQNLKSFFSFKKKFDLIGIPVTGAFIVIIFEALNFIPQISLNPLPAIIIFIFYLSAFAVASYSENKKRFTEPLNKLKTIMDEIAEVKS